MTKLACSKHMFDKDFTITETTYKIKRQITEYIKKRSWHWLNNIRN
jgi:hypothetical protein